VNIASKATTGAIENPARAMEPLVPRRASVLFLSFLLTRAERELFHVSSPFDPKGGISDVLASFSTISALMVFHTGREPAGDSRFWWYAIERLSLESRNHENSAIPIGSTNQDSQPLHPTSPTHPQSPHTFSRSHGLGPSYPPRPQ